MTGLDDAAKFVQKLGGDAIWDRIAEKEREKYRGIVLKIVEMASTGPGGVGAGSGEGRVSRVRNLADSMDDMRRMLPESFATAYDALWSTAYSDGGVDGGAGLGGGGNHPLNGSGAVVGVATGKLEGKDVRVNSGQRDFVATRKRGGPDKTKKVGKTSRTLKDERAYKLKVRIDKQLRKIARGVVAELEGRNVAAAVGRVCTGRCKKFGDGEWDYCCRCGGPMREIEENEH